MPSAKGDASFCYWDDMREDAYFVYAHNNRCMPHFHQSFEMLYVLAGKVCAVLDGQLYEVGAGQMLLVNSFVIHYYDTPETSDTLVIVAPLSIVPQLRAQFSTHEFHPFLFVPEDDLRQLVSYMANNWSRWSKTVHHHSCLLLIGMLTERYHQEIPHRTPNDSLVREVLMYITDYHTQDISLPDLAKNVGYSQSRLSHLFKAYFGRSFVRLVNDFRCRTALTLLRNTDQKVIDVAYAAGFNSVRTFYRAFMGCFGVAPQQHVTLKRQHAAPEGSIRYLDIEPMDAKRLIAENDTKLE